MAKGPGLLILDVCKNMPDPELNRKQVASGILDILDFPAEIHPLLVKPKSPVQPLQEHLKAAKMGAVM